MGRERNGIEEGMVDEACTGVVLWVGGHGVWGRGEWGVYVVVYVWICLYIHMYVQLMSPFFFCFLVSSSDSEKSSSSSSLTVFSSFAFFV